jgi:AhpD family alkylhydroperoxidase
MPNSVYPPPSPELSQKRRAFAPDIEAAFDAFSQRVFADGALPAKTKQVIAVAVAHVTQCPYCIKGHTKAALRQGATREELMEAIWVAAEMRAGGPTLIRPFRSWQWMKLLIEPRAADGRRLQPPTGGHGVIGNKGAFAARS